MRKRRALWVGIAAAACLGAFLLSPLSYPVWGWLRNEPFYRGWPASYWGKQLLAFMDRSPYDFTLVEVVQIKFFNIRPSRLPAVAEGDPAAIPVLVSLLHFQDHRVREAAACELGHMKADPTAFVPALTEALTDGQVMVRAYAAESLAVVGQRPREAIPVLVEALEDPDVNARCVAARCGKFGPEARAAVPALIAALIDKDEGVQVRAGKALRSIDPEAAKKAGVKSFDPREAGIEGVP